MNDIHHRRNSRTTGGFTLLEILTGTFILVIVAVPMSLLMTGSSRAVMKVDRNREVRSMMDQIMRRVESTDLTILWENFGVDPQSPERMDGRVAEAGSGDEPGHNPLLLDSGLLKRLGELGLKCDLRYRFMSRDELGVDAANRLKSSSGLLHLQAGVATLQLSGKIGKRTIEEVRTRPIYCPMIIGKPGLLLSQCPAVNPALRDVKFAHIP